MDCENTTRMGTKMSAGAGSVEVRRSDKVAGVHLILTGPSCHSGLNAPPPASQSFVPGGAGEGMRLTRIDIEEPWRLKESFSFRGRTSRKVTFRFYLMVTERSDSVIIHNLSPACVR
jgi:hypothetical protein